MLRSTTSWAVLAAVLSAAAPAAAQTAASNVEELVVTGQRASQQKAIDAKRNATGVIDAISADDLGRLADKNVAENLERLPGVGLFYDQGEGRYVSIRGIDSSLSNVTLNGIELGNPDGLGAEARVPLDVVGGQLLSRLEVIKVVTPDMDAQGIGGAVNLVTQSPFDFKQGVFARGNAQIGYQEALKGSQPWQADATVGGIFGDGKWGAMIGVSASSRKFRSNGFFPDDWRAAPGARGGLPTTIKYTNYTIKRERKGVSGALEFRPTDEDKFFVRGLYSKFTEDEHRQRFRADFGSNLNNVTFNADGYTGVAVNVDAREDLREEYKEKSFTSISIGGENARGPWTFDYDLAYGYDKVVEPNRLWQFRSVSATGTTLDFDMRPLLFTAEPRNLPLTNMGFRQYTEQDENGNEINWAGRVNARYDVDWGDGGFVKFGVKLRDEDKKFDGRTDIYDRAGAGANRFTLADFDLRGPNESVVFNDRTYVMRYVIGEAIKPFTEQNLSGPRFVKNLTTSLTNNVVNDYGLNERIYAGYGMADVRFGRLRVIGGLRVERTETDVHGFRVTPVNGAVTAVSESNSYTDVLPNLQLRFEPREDVVLRAAYSRTLGRPTFGQLEISGSLTFTQLNNGQFEGDLDAGNVDLKPFISDNLDATAEWYFAPGGLLSASAFHKRIKNPIFNFRQTFTNITLDGRTFATLRYTQPRNAEEGKITGLELAYQHQFVFLPGLLSGFGAAANLTLIDSHVDTFDRRASFRQQANVIYGGQIFYQKGPLEAALSFHHTGKNLDSLGATAASDTYNDRYERLDLKASYAINERIELFVEGQNLTDTKLRQYIGNRRDWITNYERLRQTYYVGVSARW